MKKIVLSLLLILCLVSIASAQVLIGAKSAGMGGTGVANADGLTSIYYNPAGLMKGKSFGLDISLAPAYTDYQKVYDAVSKSTDIASFLVDNYANALAMNGDVSAQVGFNFNKIGISAIILPLGSYAADTLAGNNTIFVSKAANSVLAQASYSTRYDYVLTLGRTFNPAFLPASLDAGINIKSVNAVYGTFTPAAAATSAPYTSAIGNGTAFDLGLRTTLDVPALGSAAVGVAMRDISGKINYSRKQKTYYLDDTTGTITESAESILADASVTLNSVTVVGIAGKIAAINLGVAADVEMANAGSTTHLGVELPFLANLIIARAGTISGPSINKMTYGAKLNLPILTVDAAGVIDSNDNNKKAWTIDFGLGF